MEPKTLFEYDLEKGKESTGTWGNYAVRYFDSGVLCVEIGDGYRHNIRIEPKHWNRILRIIHDDELDDEGITAIVKGLMWAGLREEHVETFIKAIKSGAIRELKNK